METNSFDVIIVGSGIIGLAFAYTLHKKGKKVLVLEQHSHPVSSSIRNFGLITVTGQPYQFEWELARRGSEIWTQVLQDLNIEPSQKGCVFTARSGIGEQLLNEYLNSEAGRKCKAVSKQQLRESFPYLSDQIRFAIKSPYELSLDSGMVITKLIAYLKECGVIFKFNCRVFSFLNNIVQCSLGKFQADKVIVASGVDTRFLFPNLWKDHDIKICKLQMQLVRSKIPLLISHSVMSDFSYHFYRGFKQMPSSVKLSSWFEENYPIHFKYHMHLIAVKKSNGDFIIGDSHEYLDEIDPFEKEEIYDLQLQELNNVFNLNSWQNLQRWIGYYPWSEKSPTIIEKVDDYVTIVLVNRGKGMTISFALAEKFVNND